VGLKCVKYRKKSVKRFKFETRERERERERERQTLRCHRDYISIRVVVKEGM
jgi:hypothetical protein